jgi:hypothetical protein
VHNRLAEFRVRRGLSQFEVAAGLSELAGRDLGLDQHAVSRHERGVYRPQRHHRELYCRFYRVCDPAVLWPPVGAAGPLSDPVVSAPWEWRGTLRAAAELRDVPPVGVSGSRSGASGGAGRMERRAFLWLSGVALTGPAHEWLVREPGPLLAALGGDRVTPEFAGRLPGMVAELRRMDDVQAPGAVLSLARREFSWVSELLESGSYSDEVGRRLYVVLADLAQIAGFTAWDAQDHELAQRFYLTGLRAAHTAGDRPLGAHILQSMAQQALYADRPQDAVMLVDSALTGARGHSSPAQLAQLHAWRARACAAVGDTSASEQAQGRSFDLADRIGEDSQPSWLYWMRPSDVTTWAGATALELEQPRRADELLTQGIRAMAPDRPLSGQVISNVQLASARIRTGELDGAVETSHRVLDLAARRLSPRALDNISTLRQELDPHVASPTVRDLADRISDLTAAGRAMS